tara:strand:- start:221 stop:424 length:204 start_codon:yes stop_codon:yes gene_type:complete
MSDIECEECGELADLEVEYSDKETENFCRNCYNNGLRDIIRRYTNRHIDDLIWAIKCFSDNVVQIKN